MERGDLPAQFIQFGLLFLYLFLSHHLCQLFLSPDPLVRDQNIAPPPKDKE